MIKDKLIAKLREENMDTLPIDITVKYLRKDGSCRVSALFAAKDLNCMLRDHGLAIKDIKHFYAKEKNGRVYIDCTAQE